MAKIILLADDSVTIQKAVQMTFARGNYEVVAVGNGEDCIRQARRLKPQIIIADVNMPEVNGYEVCRTVKNDEDLRKIPVVLLAGTFESFDKEEAKQVGAEAHLTKPFESEAIINLVNEIAVSAVASTADMRTAGFLSEQEEVQESPASDEPEEVALSDIISAAPDSTEHQAEELPQFEAVEGVAEKSEDEFIDPLMPLEPERKDGISWEAKDEGFDPFGAPPPLPEDRKGPAVIDEPVMSPMTPPISPLPFSSPLLESAGQAEKPAAEPLFDIPPFAAGPAEQDMPMLEAEMVESSPEATADDILEPEDVDVEIVEPTFELADTIPPLEPIALSAEQVESEISPRDSAIQFADTISPLEPLRIEPEKEEPAAEVDLELETADTMPLLEPLVAEAEQVEAEAVEPAAEADLELETADTVPPPEPLVVEAEQVEAEAVEPAAEADLELETADTMPPLESVMEDSLSVPPETVDSNQVLLETEPVPERTFVKPLSVEPEAVEFIPEEQSSEEADLPVESSEAPPAAMEFTEVESTVLSEEVATAAEFMEFTAVEDSAAPKKQQTASPAPGFQPGQWLVPIVTFVPWQGAQITGAPPSTPLPIALPEGWAAMGSLPLQAGATAAETNEAPEGAPVPSEAPSISAEDVKRLCREAIEKAVEELLPQLAETFIKGNQRLIEKIAWEVVPELAETIVREEARNKKG